MEQSISYVSQRKIDVYLSGNCNSELYPLTRQCTDSLSITISPQDVGIEKIKQLETNNCRHLCTLTIQIGVVSMHTMQ